MSDEQDRADVARVRAGLTDAFAGIVRRWQRPLLTLAFRFARDHSLAEDMTQLALVTAYRKLDQWKGETRFANWLFAVATNVFRSQLRRTRPPGMALDLVLKVATEEELPHDAEARASYREELIRRAVLGLPPKYRDALVLFYFHDMDVEQAASSLELPVGTLKARLHRGRALLEGELKPLLEERGRTDSQAASEPDQ